MIVVATGIGETFPGWPAHDAVGIGPKPQRDFEPLVLDVDGSIRDPSEPTDGMAIREGLWPSRHAAIP